MKASQISRRKLFDRAWSKPMTTNAAELGTTAAALAKMARGLGLPLPSSGHWMKKEAGKEPPVPDYPADPSQDRELYSIPGSSRRSTALSAAKTAPEIAGSFGTGDTTMAPGPDGISPKEAGEHRKVSSTRNAILKSRATDRASIRGRGKFRLLIAPASGERACAILDQIVSSAEANGWKLESTDQGYAASHTRRSFSDGKRQRLEHLVPAIIEAMTRRAEAIKARRVEDEKRKQEWAEAEDLRKDRERQARVDGYRIAFLQRQIERKREIDGLSGLIANWQDAEGVDPQFAELLHFARRYKEELEAHIAPAAVAERVAALNLMDDDVYIYDAKRLN